MRTICLLIAFLGLASGQERVISGAVRDAAGGAVAGAVVRLQSTALKTNTDLQGRFRLANLPSQPLFALTAFAPGYYIAGPVQARAGDSAISFLLRKHPAEDHPGYEWVSALASAGEAGNCQNCHSQPGEPLSLLPFDEWQRDAHGTSARNRRFLSMYNGTDLSGENRSPLTRFFNHKDYGPVPVPPDPNLPYYGPGFKLDFPNSAGDCAACHLPAAAHRAPYDTDPNTVSGVGREGVACDLCHKTWSVRTNPATGLPYPNTPGVLSMDFRRPPPGEQLFLGPYDDVAPGDDSQSALQNQSRICAPCHFARFWGVQVYNSFGEWMDSPYSDPETGKTCQDCHMPRRGATRFVRADKGALNRDPATVFSHLMPGAADVELLRDTAGLRLEAWREGPDVRVYVVVSNEKAGHHMPTDHPARNMLLVVTAAGVGGEQLPLVWGPLIPDWGGKGDASDDYAGRPGKGYAKILEELWTEVSPTAAYWNPCVIREDTRIPALATDLANFGFRSPPGGGPVTVAARLIFRRAFKSLRVQKGWDSPDILMNEAAVVVR